jgi:hypothetical protein
MAALTIVYFAVGSARLPINPLAHAAGAALSDFGPRYKQRLRCHWIVAYCVLLAVHLLVSAHVDLDNAGYYVTISLLSAMRGAMDACLVDTVRRLECLELSHGIVIGRVAMVLALGSMFAVWFTVDVVPSIGRDDTILVGSCIPLVTVLAAVCIKDPAGPKYRLIRTAFASIKETLHMRHVIGMALVLAMVNALPATDEVDPPVMGAGEFGRFLAAGAYLIAGRYFRVRMTVLWGIVLFAVTQVAQGFVDDLSGDLGPRSVLHVMEGFSKQTLSLPVWVTLAHCMRPDAVGVTWSMFIALTVGSEAIGRALAGALFDSFDGDSGMLIAHGAICATLAILAMIPLRFISDPEIHFRTK